MAQMQKRVSLGRRFFGWFARHKITAVFAVLVVALSLYLFGSWIVLQAQIHSERERFMIVQGDIARISRTLGSTAAPHTQQYCYYESSPTEFVAGNRLCAVRLTIIGSAIEKDNALATFLHTKDVVQKNMSPGSNVVGDNYSLGAGGFSDQGVSCFLESEYYGPGLPVSVRVAGAPSGDDSLYIDLLCSGPAKAEYFSMVKH